jgi:hypothetical protein
VRYAFSGYSSLSVLLFAALFWKRSTKWGRAGGRAVDRIRRPLRAERLAAAWFGLMPRPDSSRLLMIVVAAEPMRPSFWQLLAL